MLFLGLFYEIFPVAAVFSLSSLEKTYDANYRFLLRPGRGGLLVFMIDLMKKSDVLATGYSFWRIWLTIMFETAVVASC